MRQYLLAVIAVLAAIILALFSIDTASNQQSARSYRAYNFKSGLESRADNQGSALWNDNAGNVCIPPINETVTDNGFFPLTIASSPLSTPPSMLATSAMTELTPVQLPPLDAGMVNVTGGFDGNGQTAGYRVNPRPGEFAIAVPYDPSLLPQGFTEDDIQTYVYDRQYHRWVAIQRDSVNEAELLVCSRFKPWGKGLPHTLNDLANPQDALMQVQDMMSFAPQGEGGGDSPLDFINAVLKTPEMPETSAYTPTSIKELKAADPLEGLTLMQPPTANNSGTANLSYPIEIPAGRQGMQPNLALTYSSGGGNGWLGVGWDISIPSITVETRWGVPRYDQSKESEVYVYEGEQLVTKDGNGNFREMPHRTNQWTSRSTLGNEEQFFPRKNEAFDSIVRHGTGPGNYWWTVTHKNGVTDYYGKYASDNGVNNSCVLRAGASNFTGAIAQWALAESVDPFGNSVRYHYDIEYHRGTTGSSNDGKQIYVDTIYYTTKGNDLGKYKVVFTREPKEDVIVSANRGFKEVTASNLCNIAVCFNNRAIRYYLFLTENCRASNFKTRLTDVVQLYKTSNGILPCSYLKELGVTDTLVSTHFDYYNYPETNQMFGDTVSLSLNDDDIKSTFITSGSALAKATALGGTRGKSWNIGGTMTVGIGPVVPLTTASVGGNFNYSRSKSEGALTLIDLDGDGLADKVYKKGRKLYFRKHIADSEYHFHYDSYEQELMDYSDVQNPRNLSDFLSEVSSTTTWGLQLSLGLAYSGSWPTTKSTTSVYFADVNADGLPDLITDGGVLFNVTEQDGEVKFRNYYTIAAENIGTGNDSAFVHTTTDTCGGIIFSGTVSDSIVCQYDWLLDTTLWLKPVYTPYDTADFLPVIRYADSLENTGEYKCEYYYYRNQPGQIERIDIYRKVLVSCSAFPTSTSASDILERDPDLEAVKVWVAPNYGVVDIISDIRQRQDSTTSFLQSKTRDGMSYAIQLNRNVVATLNHRLLPSASTNISILANGQIGKDDISVHHDSVRVPVSPGDLVFFRLISGENHDYDNVEWNQTIRFGTGLSRPVVYNSAADFVLSGNKNFGAGAAGSTNKIDMSVKITTGNIGSTPNAALYAMVVDTNDNVITNCLWLCPLQSGWTNHVWNPLGTSTTTMQIAQGHQVKFFVSSSNPSFQWEKVRVSPHINYYVWNINHYDTVECYPQVDMLINNYDGTVRDSVYHRLFGPLYKGWGQFAYNNNDTVNGHVVHDSYIHIEKLVTDWGGDIQNKKEARKTRRRMQLFDMPDKDSTHVRESSDMVGLYDADTLYNPLSLKTSWVEMQPDFHHYAWVGYGNVNYITDSIMCNTRIPDYHTDENTSDIEDYDHPVPVVAQGLDVKTVRKQNYSKMKNHSLSLSAPGVPFSVGGSVSLGYNQIITDYMDLNGDRYPDILGSSQVQYSQPWGGIGDVKTMAIFSNGVSRSETASGGMNFGGSFEMPSRGASNNPKNSKISFDGAGSIGASHGGGSDTTSMTWMDMNGDGLPDKVVRRNDKLEVQMNTGYGFLNIDTFNINNIRDGSSANTGLNVGGNFNIGQASIGGGIGVNFSKNETEKMLMDFNGDGLQDIVEDFGNSMKVSYNLGNGHWSAPEYVYAVPEISLGRSFSESADVSVTVGFTFMSIVKLCVGISGSPYSRTFSKDSVQLTDVNGDGYVDYVTSRNEGSMTVRYNQSGKTNLLRKVTNFTGSTIGLGYDMPLACFDKPQRSWNLARVETRNNDTLCPVGGNRTLTKFQYASPRYNRYERMDYGYGKVTTYQYDTDGGDTLYRFTVEEFNNREFNKRGRKLRDCVYNSDSLPYVEHIYGDTLYDYAGSLVTDGGCARTDVYVKKEVDITNWYEGQPSPQITSMTQREYDRYRNVERYTHYGDITHTDEYFRAEIEYAQNMPHNMVSLPVRIEVYDIDDTLLQMRTADYNPYNGRMTTLRLHNYSDTARYDFGYDSYGNMGDATMPANANGQRLTMKYQYDNTVHTYPVWVLNSDLGYYSTAEYDLRFGKPTKTMDINGNEMWYEYDSLGRTVTVTAPYEQGVAPYTIRMEYFPHNFKKLDVWTNCSNPYSYACTYHYDKQHLGNPIVTTILSDGLGRLLQTKKDAEIGGQEVSLVTGKVVYDCFGRTVAQYHPFTEPLGTETVYNNTVTTGTGTLTAYDMMDRQTRVRQQPYGYETVMDYGFDWWNGKTLFRTETTDANGNVFTEMKGTLGQQLVQLPSTTNATELYYDALGRLTESMDAEGISTYYEYDRLGRMTHRTHPDAGEDWYSFDPAGNTVYHVNGNGDTVRYKYYFNLLTAMSYPNNPANNVRYVYGSPSSPDNTAGKIILQEDASGWQTFKYGKLGEVIENIRTFALPNEPRPYTFKMKFYYDSWNRIDSMTYPDGEVVSYGYNKGGMLENIQGNKNGDVRTYVKDIRYNKFELKESEKYGNGTQMGYEYDSLLRLSHLYSWDSHGDTMQSIGYTYDYVGNITDIANSAVTLPNGLGGRYYSHYDYDPLYRLTGAYGNWNNNQLSYNLGMQYYGNGKIWSKQLYADVLDQGNVTVRNYNNRYYYGSSTSNTVTSVYDQIGHVWQSFSWDMAGNMVYHQDANGCGRTLCWDEENRLMSFADCENAGFYQYDAGGERTYKLTSDYVSQNIGGHWHTYQVLDNPTLYTSPYMVATPKGYTKHYYAESERVASRIGGGLDSVDMFIRNIEEFIDKPMVEISPLWTDDYHEEFFDEKRDHNLDHLYHAMECTGNVPSVVYECLTILYKYSEYPHHEYEPDCYWYHPDHLGSSSWITYTDGSAVQHLHYLPWGEDFVDQRSTNWNAMYTFSAKEKDTETGYSYFGSRYYSSALSIWLSVDPMSDKYPSMSPYVYCADNPVKLVDPNGEDWYEVENTETHEMEIKWTDHKSQADMDAAGVKGTYLGEAFMDIKGSRSEKLGAGNNLFNEGAVLAKATVYGPSGKDDIKEYDAFTMSSDFSKYGAIADGDYTVNYRDPGKSGPLSSNWAVNDAEPVNCLDGKNPNPKGYSPTQKNGIYIHRSNNNGDMLPSGHPVSTGCIIIVPSRTGKNGWNEFNQQLSGVSSFKMRLKRD